MWFASNPRVWWGLLDILWAWPIKYLMNQVNSMVLLMPIEWFSTVWVFNVISHSIKILERSNIFINGTKKVHNFNENEFHISTVMGNLVIKGSNLELIKLDTNDGNICIKGKINSVNYLDGIDGEKEDGFFSKLFK